MQDIAFSTQSYRIGQWTIVRLPDNASAKLPSRGQVMVMGTVNGTSFQSPLEPDGQGGHWFSLDDRTAKAAGSKPGDNVDVTLEPTKAWPEPDVPADVAAALERDKQAGATWNIVTPMARWEWLRWINSTSNPETRKRRIEAACSKMRAGERRPCCFNRNMCCIPEVSKNGVLLQPADSSA